MRSSLLFLIAVQQLFGYMNGQEGEKMTFTMPEVTEEEQHSMHIPSNMACDACTAVAYQVSLHLKKAEAKKRKPLIESEYLDLFDWICHTNTFNDYGIKAVNGVNRLSGDGTEAKDVPGMMQGGGKWPGRLGEKCGTMIGDIGEDEVYAEYRKTKGDLLNLFCKVSTKDCLKGGKKQEL